MAYYPDLSTYEYYARQIDAHVVNVGWLDHSHNFPTMPANEEVLDLLWIYCQKPQRQSKGFHQCELCTHPTFAITVSRGGVTLHLGSAEIRVVGENGVIYAAPDLIYHYVADHQYQPPEEFIEALLNSNSKD